MRLSKASLVVVVGVCLVLAILSAFAFELADTQAKSKQDVRTQVHQRAVLAGALIDSLFQSTQQTIPQESKTYGARVVSTATMDSNASQDAFLALLDSKGSVIASSRGFTPQAHSGLAKSGALALLSSGELYGLGDYAAYGNTGVIEFAVSFPTTYGTRTLVTGFAPSALSTFIAHELATIPGVKGSYNYLVDGNGVVLASTNSAGAVGQVLGVPGAAEGLRHASGEARGTYFEQAALTNSHWRIVLTSPNGRLFASVTGLRQQVPWLIFSAFALVALIALALGWRVLRTADQLRTVNQRLESLNEDLIGVNSALERRAAELARSNEELDQFASIASHDLQEPLRKVRTFTQELSVLEESRLSDKGRDYLQRTNSAAERMQRLIEDLLRFSRVSTQGRPFVDVDLQAVTQEVLGDLDAQIAATGALINVGPLPTLRADPLQMHQLVQNLVSNAIKFHRPDVVPVVDISAVVAGDKVLLSVHDNGIGFDPRYSQRIFRVFERLHGRNEYPGTGIGLSVCRKIADRHGGTIVADGEPGSGSTFTVTLPLHNDTAPVIDLERDAPAVPVPGEAHAHA